jgi:hypothetical protein
MSAKPARSMVVGECRSCETDVMQPFVGAGGFHRGTPQPRDNKRDHFLLCRKCIRAILDLIYNGELKEGAPPPRDV